MLNLIASIFFVFSGVAHAGGGGFVGAGGGGTGGSVNASQITGVISQANLPQSTTVTTSTDDAKLPILVLSTGVFNSSWTATYFALASTTTPNPLRKNMIWLSTSNQLSFSPDGAAIQVFSTNTAGVAVVGSPSQMIYNLAGAYAGSANMVVNASSGVFGSATFGVYTSSPLVVMGTAGTTAICQASLEVGTGTRCPNGGANGALLLVRGPGAGYLAYTDQSDGTESLLGADSSSSYAGINILGKPFEVRAGANLSRIRVGVGLGVFIGSGHIDNPNATLIVRSTSNLPTDFSFKAQSSQGNDQFSIQNSSQVIFATGTLMGIGMANPGSTLYVNGTLGQSALTACSTGAQTSSSGTFNACVASDQRLKKDIVPMVHKIGSVDVLPTSNFRFIDAERGRGLRGGYVAQSMAKVWPECVVPAGGDYKGVDANCVSAHLAEEIKASRKEIKALRSRVRKLEGK